MKLRQQCFSSDPSFLKVLGEKGEIILLNTFTSLQIYIQSEPQTRCQAPPESWVKPSRSRRSLTTQTEFTYGLGNVAVLCIWHFFRAIPTNDITHNRFFQPGCVQLYTDPPKQGPSHQSTRHLRPLSALAVDRRALSWRCSLALCYSSYLPT